MQELEEEEEEIEREEGGVFFKGIINSLNALVEQCYHPVVLDSAAVMVFCCSICFNSLFRALYFFLHLLFDTLLLAFITKFQALEWIWVSLKLGCGHLYFVHLHIFIDSVLSFQAK